VPLVPSWNPATSSRRRVGTTRSDFCRRADVARVATRYTLRDDVDEIARDSAITPRFTKERESFRDRRERSRRAHLFTNAALLLSSPTPDPRPRISSESVVVRKAS